MGEQALDVRDFDDVTDFLTPVDHVFVRAHLGVPDVDADSWTLSVEGLVERPLLLRLDDVLALPARRFTAFHECFGNPFRPDVPTRAVANLRWTGFDLSVLLDRAGPLAAARHVLFEGADTGSFDGEDGLSYVKDLPLETARRDVFLAYEMNGEPLTARHGHPLRAVVPRMFGTNSVKWLTRIVLAEERPDHMFTTRFYTRVHPGEQVRRPVRAVDVGSKILSPRDGDQLADGIVELVGRAWSVGEVVSVEVSVDDGDWRPASLDPLGDEPAWQPFTLSLRLPPGPHRIRARATDRDGRVQPPPGLRNSVHEITVTVTPGGAAAEA
ncbi:molybdopterin-dependent oxidoreductase [Streptomyces crystallinus]|uniref:Oxidoreductase molybdopterin-binding domain-containing protein n=1 Tax=Streptomyces crystallinus TaxID=68191 RepID=A0ABN1GW94_9ACTN